MKFCPNCSTLLRIVDNIDEIYTQTGGNKITNLIESILEDKQNLKELLLNIDINTITTSNEYKQLSLENQEIIYNKIQELLPKSQKKINQKKKTTNESSKNIFYVCLDCSYYSKLEPTTLIYSETKNKKDTNVTDFSYMVNNPILPRTTEFTCINSDCTSHQDGGLAVYFRHNNKVIHICETCKYQWS